VGEDSAMPTAIRYVLLSAVKNMVGTQMQLTNTPELGMSCQTASGFKVPFHSRYYVCETFYYAPAFPEIKFQTILTFTQQKAPPKTPKHSY